MRLLVLSIIFMACSGSLKYYEYADGNGNRYTIRKAQVTYSTVTPEVSSSGSYSGGQPAKMEINQQIYDSLLHTIMSAIQNKKVHITDRIMMSGSISEVTGDTRNTYILSPGCTEQKELEKMLTNIKHQ